MITVAPPVLAAGALCWRLVDGKPRILVVHRAARADVSLPKGKVDPGETLPETAVREIAEETGLSIVLGSPLGTVVYTLPSGREKVVYYWSAEVDDHALELAKFTANDEIAALEWLPLAKARKKLSYAHDVDVIDRFAARLEAGQARTFALVAVRHGKAVPPQNWDGPDATRPLMHRGTDQAATITGGIAAYAPERIISSSATRCLATVAPLAERTGLQVKATADISQDAYEYGKSKVPSVVAKRIAKGQSAVLCSHGPVLPVILSEIATQTSTPLTRELRSASMLSTGEFAVIHLNSTSPQHEIVAVEIHSPPVA